MPIQPGVLKKIRSYCRKNSAIECLYLFGSRANGVVHRESDYDFALLAGHKKNLNLARLQLEATAKLIELLGSDKIDLLLLNHTRNLILKHDIISNGCSIFRRGGASDDYVISTLNEYFDFRLLERRYYGEQI